MQEPAEPGGGEALFLAHLPLIDRLIAQTCARQSFFGADAEDFASHVKLKFVEDDYAMLRQFEGRSSLRSYLAVVIQRLLLDYQNALWGKWRPSAEARRVGPVGVLFEQLTTRDGFSFHEATELLNSRYGFAVTAADLERIAGRLPARTKRMFLPEEVLWDVATAHRSDEGVEAREREAIATRVNATLVATLHGLPPPDRLILMMRFEDGRSVAEIASVLRLEQKPLYQRIQRLLRDLRGSLEASGIQPETIRDLFDAPESGVAALEHQRNPAAGSSIRKGAQA